MERSKREVTLRFLAEPTDVNFGGKVHGGAVMKWIDQAAYACAVGWSRQYCVTVHVSSIRFYKPILIGHLVEVHARLIYTGRTSMHIAVDVSAGDPKEEEFTKTTHCIVVFVAVDAEGRPAEVASWKPQTPEDEAFENYAKQVMDCQNRVEREMNVPKSP